MTAIALAVSDHRSRLDLLRDDPVLTTEKPAEMPQSELNRLNDFLGTYTALHFPGYVYDHTYSIAKGSDAYDVTMQRTRLFTREQESLSAVLDGNGLCPDSNFRKSPYYNDFAFASYYSHNFIQNPLQVSQTEECIAKLPDFVELEAYVSFTHDITVDDLYALKQNYSGVFFKWAGVRCSPYEYSATKGDFAAVTQPDYQNQLSLSLLAGFDMSGIAYGTSFLDSYTDLTTAVNKDTGNYEPYFKDLIMKMLGFPDYLQMLEKAENNGEEPDEWRYADFYRSILDYIEENGVRSYGVAVIARPGKLLELSRDKNVYQVVIGDMRLNYK